MAFFVRSFDFPYNLNTVDNTNAFKFCLQNYCVNTCGLYSFGKVKPGELVFDAEILLPWISGKIVVGIAEDPSFVQVSLDKDTRFDV